MAGDSPRRLTRSQDRKVAGVCGGIADYLDADPTLIRLGFVALALLTALGPTALGYAILWIVMPEASGPPRPRSAQGPGEAGMIIGIVLLGVAFIALMGRGWWGMPHMPIPGWGGLQFLWLIALIVAGAWLVTASRRR